MHYLAAVLSSFSSSVTSIFGKLLFTIGASVSQILFIRFFISFLISFLVFIFIKKKFNFRNFVIFGILGILNYGIAAYLFFFGLQFLNPAYATVLFFTNPVFVLLFQKIFYKDKIGTFNWIAIVTSILGVFFANLGEQSLEKDDEIIIGTLIIIAAAIINALFITVTGKKLKNLTSNVFENVFYTFFGVTLYYLLITSFTKELSTIKFEYVSYGLLLSIFSTFIPLTLSFFSLKKLKSQTVAIIMPLEIVFASVLSLLIFGETFNLLKILGFILISTAPILENFK
ncbi:DMT family transporter [Thermosipho atlanticus]|uniref:Threonine/homoserine efflux transporter RhtA n=1 Tax=Thermosipho atlanticus DSM 15807 TaxID=1123380 RepID=A0A1M5STE1_9BACT|nr:DMT family transporter [Thermosipho atlanticus]SHH41774.1 Threonine/homoserine efflux transporter RhtA [Thermosipho atlanticus DSM 15807]